MIKQDKMDFLVIEVKCPNSNANDDLFKLSIELQILLLNRLANIGVDYPMVFGVAVHAPTMYRMVKFRSCFIPRDLNDFDVIRNTLASLSQLRDLVLSKVEQAQKSNAKISKSLTWIRDPVIDYKDSDYKLSSCSFTIAQNFDYYVASQTNKWNRSTTSHIERSEEMIPPVIIERKRQEINFYKIQLDSLHDEKTHTEPNQLLTRRNQRGNQNIDVSR
ncbi:hypothetical protein [Parasitella parasitica]|uniref:Uncharacterized protein n=1 Tax=Parasitella parasitica TaxID=35722 RepID=A0A0B7NQL1_9FUNG|nr:hypothetical protein [Parasitella parasitica]